MFLPCSSLGIYWWTLPETDYSVRLTFWLAHNRQFILLCSPIDLQRCVSRAESPFAGYDIKF